MLQITLGVYVNDGNSASLIGSIAVINLCYIYNFIGWA